MAFDPGTLALTGWWRANFTGSPWSPTASAGASGTNGNLAEATNPPAVGVAQNGSTPADFNGTNQQLSNGTAWSSLFSASGGSLSLLYIADTAPAASALVYDNPALLVDGTSGFNGLHVSSTGVHAYVDDGALKTVSAAASAGAYHRAQMTWDGTFLYVRVDGGTWNQVACGPAAHLADTLAIGRNYASVSFFDGRILEVLTAATSFSFGTFDSIDAYYLERYFAAAGTGLAPGRPFSGVAARGPVRHFIPSPNNAAFLTTAQPHVDQGFRDFASEQSPMPLTAGPARHFVGPRMLGVVSAQQFVARGFPRAGLPIPVGPGPFGFGPFDGGRSPFELAYSAPSGSIGVLAGTSANVAGQSGTLLGAGALSATCANAAGQSGALVGAGALAATCAGTSGQSGTLDQPAGGVLAGTIACTSSQTGTLAATGSLAATCANTAGQSGTLAATGSLAATCANTAGQSGTLAATGSLAATCSNTAGQTGTITGAGALNGSAVGTSTCSLGINAGATSGTVAGTCTVVATLAGIGTLAATCNATSSQTAVLLGAGTLAATCSSVASQTGILTGAGALAATTAATSSQTATLGGRGALNASTAGTCTVTATGLALGLLSATCAGSASQTGNLRGAGLLSGSVAGTCTVTATSAATFVQFVTAPHRPVGILVASDRPTSYLSAAHRPTALLTSGDRPTAILSASHVLLHL